ncbi:MAG TPA: methyltransferase domain-containing protein [Solirubrobacterales bacterium]|jgi:SAM-dependent methyltransferase|nr:methyltransferase domain-containing protein [Solirubrobacterales bacterium]
MTGEGRGVIAGESCHGGATRPNDRSAVTWHDVECGSYAADLALWEELADEADGPILDLGCGTGRVGLHLARRGHRVIGLDAAAALLAAFEERAAGLLVDLELGDARGFDLEGEFGLVLAPMQLIQLFADASERVTCLQCIVKHLRPGGQAAVAIVEKVPDAAGQTGGPPIPDAREVNGWVYSSLPIDTGLDADAIVVRRLRQTVSPDGELSDEVDETRLWRFSAEALECEAVEAGLAPVGHREIPATDAHVGSTVVLLERVA